MTVSRKADKAQAARGLGVVGARPVRHDTADKLAGPFCLPIPGLEHTHNTKRAAYRGDCPPCIPCHGPAQRPSLHDENLGSHTKVMVSATVVPPGAGRIESKGVALARTDRG